MAPEDQADTDGAAVALGDGVGNRSAKTAAVDSVSDVQATEEVSVLWGSPVKRERKVFFFFLICSTLKAQKFFRWIGRKLATLKVYIISGSTTIAMNTKDEMDGRRKSDKGKWRKRGGKSKRGQKGFVCR